jgi:diphosphomevalonate decarboxylase
MSTINTTTTDASGNQHDVCGLTATSPTNIAVVKYWGKRDVQLNLPINSSVSVTLDQSDLKTITTVTASTAFTTQGDRLWLNGTEEDVASNRRLVVVFREMRRLAREAPQSVRDTALIKNADEVSFWVKSRNTFPTAAGLASSASGYACLTFALSRLLGLATTPEVTAVARQGYGSACRSLFGGFVRWTMGEKEDGSDSVASQVAPAEHWPEMEALIMVASKAKKHTSSTSGMMTSVATSSLLAHRAATVVPERMVQMEAAYMSKDFQAFGELTMRDSNQFHATCLDTFPPIFYMNDVSRQVANAVHTINASYGKIVAAYTYDAGPNAVIYVLKEDALDVLALLLIAFPAGEGQGEGVVGGEGGVGGGYVLSNQVEETMKMVNDGGFSSQVNNELVEQMKKISEKGRLIQIIHTRVGPGPQVIDAEPESFWEV